MEADVGHESAEDNGCASRNPLAAHMNARNCLAPCARKAGRGVYQLGRRPQTEEIFALHEDVFALLVTPLLLDFLVP